MDSTSTFSLRRVCEDAVSRCRYHRLPPGRFTSRSFGLAVAAEFDLARVPVESWCVEVLEDLDCAIRPPGEATWQLLPEVA